MSEIHSEDEDFIDDIVDTGELEESSDEEILDDKDFQSETQIGTLKSNKYLDILKTNCKNPSRFIVHALIMRRVDSLFKGAKPFVDDSEVFLKGNYDEIFLALVNIAVEEVKAGVSPMMFYNPILKQQMSVNELNTELFLQIMSEAKELAKD